MLQGLSSVIDCMRLDDGQFVVQHSYNGAGYSNDVVENVSLLSERTSFVIKSSEECDNQSKNFFKYIGASRMSELERPSLKYIIWVVLKIPSFRAVSPRANGDSIIKDDLCNWQLWIVVSTIRLCDEVKAVFAMHHVNDRHGYNNDPELTWNLYDENSKLRTAATNLT